MNIKIEDFNLSILMLDTNMKKILNKYSELVRFILLIFILTFAVGAIIYFNVQYSNNFLEQLS